MHKKQVAMNIRILVPEITRRRAGGDISKVTTIMVVNAAKKHKVPAEELLAKFRSLGAKV